MGHQVTFDLSPVSRTETAMATLKYSRHRLQSLPCIRAKFLRQLLQPGELSSPSAISLGVTFCLPLGVVGTVRPRAGGRRAPIRGAAVRAGGWGIREAGPWR